MSDPEIAAAAHRVFDRKARWHREQASLQLREKVRILLELQRIDLPLLARRPAPEAVGAALGGRALT